MLFSRRKRRAKALGRIDAAASIPRAHAVRTEPRRLPQRRFDPARGVPGGISRSRLSPVCSRPNGRGCMSVVLPAGGRVPRFGGVLSIFHAGGAMLKRASVSFRSWPPSRLRGRPDCLGPRSVPALSICPCPGGTGATVVAARAAAAFLVAIGVWAWSPAWSSTNRSATLIPMRQTLASGKPQEGSQKGPRRSTTWPAPSCPKRSWPRPKRSKPTWPAEKEDARMPLPDKTPCGLSLKAILRAVLN